MPNAAEKEAAETTKKLKASKPDVKKSDYEPTEEELNAIREAYNEVNE